MNDTEDVASASKKLVEAIVGAMAREQLSRSSTAARKAHRDAEFLADAFEALASSMRDILSVAAEDVPVQDGTTMMGVLASYREKMRKVVAKTPKPRRAAGVGKANRANDDRVARVIEHVRTRGGNVAIGELAKAMDLPVKIVRLDLRRAIVRGDLHMEGERALARYWPGPLRPISEAASGDVDAAE